SGQLPATLLSQNPAWLRPMVGVKPAAKNYLNLLSFEIGRGPDNNWWVISDLIEAPSTAGFALENRVAMTKVFPNHFAGANIHRLAGFFQAFQKTIFAMRGKSDGEFAILSPGQMNQNYAEHAYIARYLGLLLVEGEDLIVQNGRVLVRTVAGPKPLSLLWNRLPGVLCDPLELDPSSLLGTPGLVDALRGQNLKMVNALGCGVLETRALMAFLPKIARKILGKELAMPNIATWWCGQQSERDHVIANRNNMMIGSAFSTLPLMSSLDSTFLATSLDSGLSAMLQDSGPELVGQEAVTLSTTPTIENGELVARPLSLRVFLARTGNGWQVMPGGYARVSAGNDAKAFAMQRGGKVADVWIVSKNTVQKPNLIASEAASALRRASNRALPSRAADNLFWLGRYVERAELALRLFRAYSARLNDGGAHDSPLLRHLRLGAMDDVMPTVAAMTARFAQPLNEALMAASKVGDRFSTDGMMALRSLVAMSRTFKETPPSAEELPREISILLRQIAGFSGLVHENMYNSDGWRFLSLGMSLERAGAMSRVLACLTDDDAPDGALDLALEIGDSVIAHRSRFSIFADQASVRDLLGLDDQNPRAIRYHISRARRQIAELPGHAEGHRLTNIARKVLLLETQLSTATVAELTPDVLKTIDRDIWLLSDDLTATHLV
ncbi:MAG: circularly permuted type 2 ATP-grasp protein, partial [Pseudorhodobacter sp.]